MRNRKKKDILSLPFTKYILISILVSFIDTSIVWILYRIVKIELVAANSTGVITGSIIHYLLSSKSVFQTRLGFKGIIIYFSTFLFGLAIADWLVYTGEQYYFTELNENVRFLCSKAVSIFVPFFILYFLRKFLFNLLNRKQVISDGQQS